MTYYRRHLKPSFQKMPKWLLLVCMIVSFPIYLLKGAVLGLIDYFFWWKLEFRDIIEMKENDE